MVRKGLTAFQIKIIAVILMTVDHLPVYIKGVDFLIEYKRKLRLLGRLSAPLFLFILVESLHHTRDKKKLILRLYLANLFSAFVNLLCNLLIPRPWQVELVNIFPTLMYTAIFVFLLENIITGVKKHDRNLIIKNTCLLLAVIILPRLVYEWSDWSRWANKLFPSLDVYHLFPFYQSLAVLVPNLFSVHYTFLFVLLGVVWYFLKTKEPTYTMANRGDHPSCFFISTIPSIPA